MVIIKDNFFVFFWVIVDSLPNEVSMSNELMTNELLTHITFIFHLSRVLFFFAEHFPEYLTTIFEYCDETFTIFTAFAFAQSPIERLIGLECDFNFFG